MCGSQTLEHEAVMMNLHWRPQNVQVATAVRNLLKKATNREWNKLKRMKCVVVNKDEKEVGDVKSALTLVMEMQSLEFSQLISFLAFRITH